jgi:eukaryotic-like serine/threonine-protein kinase
VALVAGMVVGPYQVLELVGAGGMGEVYRALDPRLGRHVALKVLPDRFAHSAERLHRFEREARATGALNHPNILTVFDVGTEGGMPYIVSELLEGETLCALLRTQRVGVRQSLSLALQAAQGLASAHDAGILHRDLKPENLFLTRDGRLKILDFGLAKLMQPESGASPDALTATGELDGGRIAGTAAYMSPEQIRGERLDARCDIFALGAILYELVSGRPPFAGDSTSDVMASVLRDDPPSIAAAGVAAPGGVEALVRRCLAKRREDRLGSAREVEAAIQAVLDSLAPQGTGTEALSARRPLGRIVLGIMLLVSGALVLSRVFSLREAPPSTPGEPSAAPMVTVPLTSYPGLEVEPAAARDGHRVAFAWDGPHSDNLDLYTKVIGAEDALRLTSHPAADGTPAWSPDGRWIAFLRVDGGHGTLFMIPSTGGTERKLRDVDPWYGSSISFSPDGRWIAFSDRPDPGTPFGVVLMAMDSRETRVITRPDASFAGDGFPAFSPDGKTLAFVRIPAMAAGFHAAIVSMVPVTGGAPSSVTTNDPQLIGGVDWTPDGREIVFAGNGGGDEVRLFRVLAKAGAPVRAVGGTPSLSNLVGAETLGQVSRRFRFSVPFGSERLIYAHSRYQSDIWRVAASSSRREPSHPFVSSTQVDDAPQFSPDGRRIAISSARASELPQIFVCDAGGGGCAQLTSFKTACGTPRWSPDGHQVVFDAREEGQAELYAVDVATRASRRLTFHPAADMVPSWSRDGASIYFTSDRAGAFDVWEMPAAGGAATRVTHGGGFAAFESFDGRDVYFTQYAKPGLWSVPVKGGPERLILDHPSCWGYWALGRNGVFVLDAAGPRGPRVALKRWGSARLQHVADVPGGPACGESGLALSPDERTLLYVEASRESDIIMLDNFR